MNCIFLLIAVLPGLALCQTSQPTTANVYSCDGKPFPHNVYVVGCEAAPCAMVRGTIGTTIVDLSIPNNTTTLQLSVRAKVGIVTIEYDLPEKDREGCNHIHPGGSTESCPLYAGDRIIYHVIQEVDKNSPTIFKPVLTFNVVDGAGESVICYTWTAEIK